MTDLRVTGPNSDGEYWLHIEAGGMMGGINLGASHGPMVQRLLDAAAIEAPAQEPVAWRWRICYREEWCWSIIKPMFSTHDLEQGTVFDVQPLYTTPADAEAHLTALLRAEYERAIWDATGVIAKLETPMIEERMNGHEDAYQAVKALLTQEGR